MKPFWKQTTAQGSAVFGHDSSYFEWRNNSFKMGRISRRWQFLDLDTSASNTTELDPYKFTHFLLEVVRSMGSFGFQIWLERRSSRVPVFYFWSRSYNSAQALTLGEKISRFRPVDSPTNDTHGGSHGTELKKLIPAWGA